MNTQDSTAHSTINRCEIVSIWPIKYRQDLGKYTWLMLYAWRNKTIIIIVNEVSLIKIIDISKYDIRNNTKIGLYSIKYI
jgi:hypothetical protein